MRKRFFDGVLIRSLQANLSFLNLLFFCVPKRKVAKEKGPPTRGAVALRKHHVFGGDEGRPSMGG
ncbi:MAG: hypothetical protein J5497_02220, partial [Selenomonadaceae bacterium]|nr:hypothetical protein [Selenomonadaceae bacterium]